MDSPPSFLMARETFTPPPPGLKRGGLQYSFRSATTCATLELLSIAGFKAMVTIVFINNLPCSTGQHMRPVFDVAAAGVDL
jgi:hypothetical protein